mmetsp:Transcript_76032/g.126677  ORF Transcript_76032/g.126677 Transcript_76032/m.126677 type:complete len:215 (-) Transcript_76032:417-1061(-)
MCMCAFIWIRGCRRLFHYCAGEGFGGFAAWRKKFGGFGTGAAWVGQKRWAPDQESTERTGEGARTRAKSPDGWLSGPLRNRRMHHVQGSDDSRWGVITKVVALVFQCLRCLSLLGNTIPQPWVKNNRRGAGGCCTHHSSNQFCCRVIGGAVRAAPVPLLPRSTREEGVQGGIKLVRLFDPLTCPVSLITAATKSVGVCLKHCVLTYLLGITCAI